VIDQVDDRVYKLDYSDGKVLHSFPTRAKHSSGITLDPAGGVWVASTFGFELLRYDPRSGAEVAALPTPEDPTVGAHALEWRDGALWANVPRTASIYQVDPRDGQVLHKIPAPGSRPHGMAWADGYEAGAEWGECAEAAALRDEPGPPTRATPLWCVETNRRAILLLDPTTGREMYELKVAGPEPHGMTIHQGRFWLCDATTREVYVVEVPTDLVPAD
jgi:streptogramin lyase